MINPNNNQQIDSENLELAPNRTRAMAFVIDDLLITLLTVVLLWDKVVATGSDTMGVLTVMNQAFLQVVLIKVIYQTFFVWYYGATIGKMAMKIKVIDFDNFGRVSFLSALFRAMTRIVSESIFYIGFVFAFYTQSRQTLHDKLGKTLVVKS
jgi:uncharacterized RDD family membrane protein YckC